MSGEEPPPVLRATSVSKRFGLLRACSDVSFALPAGQILAVLGENGAGKSTLAKILSGVLMPDEGTVEVDGEQVRLGDANSALEHGIGMVHQHFSLAPDLTVAENVVLGRETRTGPFFSASKASGVVRDVAARIGFDLDPGAKVETLSVAARQRVEIAKILARDAKVIILDEPTATLSPMDIDDLFRVVRALAESGMAVVIIVHKLSEVMALADRVMVMRSGQVVANASIDDMDEAGLARLMVGRAATVSDVVVAPREGPGETVLQLDDVTVGGQEAPLLRGLSLQVRRGEIVGIAGVDGNGQSELEEVLIGARRLDAGSVGYRMRGDGRLSDISRLDAQRRVAAGLQFVPSDRHAHAVLMDFTIEENLVLGLHAGFSTGWGMMRRQEIRRNAIALMSRFDVRASSPRALVSQLSGGNQQRVVLARAIGSRPSFLLASQPTRGLDIAATRFVHSELRDLREHAGVLVISFDLDELFAISDRILVIRNGRVSAEFAGPDYVRHEIGVAMVGSDR